MSDLYAYHRVYGDGGGGVTFEFKETDSKARLYIRINGSSLLVDEVGGDRRLERSTSNIEALKRLRDLLGIQD